MAVNLDVAAIPTYTDDLIFDARYTIINDRPLISGGVSSINLPGAVNTKAFQIPSYGFFNGSAETLTLEFWLQVDQMASLQPKTTDIIGQSSLLIKFSQYSSLRIYRNYLVLVWDKYYRTCPIAYFNSPMLINLSCTKINGAIVANLLIDGKSQLQFNINTILYDTTTKYIVFSNQTPAYRIKYGPIAMYPYAINSDLATKHFVYGQGVKVSQSLKNFTANGIMESNASYVDKQITRVDVPALYGWENFDAYNVKYENGNLMFGNYRSPTYIQSEIPYYYFDEAREYFGGFPLGIGIEANKIQQMSPYTKYVLFSVKAEDNFVVCYSYEGRIKVDARLNGSYVEEVIDIPATTYIDFSLIFEDFYGLLSYDVEKIFDSSKISVHIGYLEETLQNIEQFTIIVAGDDVPIMPYYYNEIDELAALPFKVKFLHSIINHDARNGTAYKLNYRNGAFTYQHYGVNDGNAFQVGYLSKTIPLSSITHFVDVPDDSGNTKVEEMLDYIQLNMNSTEDIGIELYFFDVTQPESITRTETKTSFNTWSELYGAAVQVSNNTIITLPPATNYDHIMMAIGININFNDIINQTRILNLNKLRIAGLARKHVGVSTFNTQNGSFVTPFTRTNSMIFPAFNSDVKVLIPSLDRPFYALNESSAFYLVDDGAYNDATWQRGFLVQQELPHTRTDEIYGYTFFFKQDYNKNNVPAATWQQSFKLARMNPIDGEYINHLSRIDIQCKSNTTFVLQKVVNNPHSMDIYVNGKLYTSGVSLLNCNEWYSVTVLYASPISLIDSQSVYLEFMAPRVYYTNVALLSFNTQSEPGLLADSLVDGQQFALFLYNLLIGNTRTSMATTDYSNYWPIIQTAWLSIYMNVMWHKQALQYEDVV